MVKIFGVAVLLGTIYILLPGKKFTSLMQLQVPKDPGEGHVIHFDIKNYKQFHFISL